MNILIILKLGRYSYYSFVIRIYSYIFAVSNKSNQLDRAIKLNNSQI